ncbi:MAG: hypothetical protein AAFQ43_01015 [Bacteroidota bacterium]
MDPHGRSEFRYRATTGRVFARAPEARLGTLTIGRPASGERRCRSRKAREETDPVGSDDEGNAARAESAPPEAITLTVNAP